MEHDPAREIESLLGELRRARGEPPTGAIGDLIAIGADAVQPLIDLLDDTDPDDDDWTPLWIAVTLGEIRDPRATPSLLRLMDLPEGEVLAEAAVEAIAKIGPRALPALTAFARDAKEWEARHYAYAALGLIPGDASLRALLDALERDPMLWAAIASALADLGDPRALPALRLLLRRCDEGEARPVREAIAILEGDEPPNPRPNEKPWRRRYEGLTA